MNPPGVPPAAKAAPAKAVPPSAVPAFVGYTENAVLDDLTLAPKARRIRSLAEFEEVFGGAPAPAQLQFDLQAVEEDGPALPGHLRIGGKAYRLRPVGGLFLLHRVLQLYFLNGGGPCFVVSAGTYYEPLALDPLLAALTALEAAAEPTLLLVPEAVQLPDEDCARLQQAMLRHCGEATKNRIALLDVPRGYRPRRSPQGDCVKAFREAVGGDFLDWGAAYYPWLHTALLPEQELGFLHLTSEGRTALVACLTAELEPLKGKNPEQPEPRYTAQMAQVARIETDPDLDGQLRKALPGLSSFYRTLRARMARRLNLLPPSAAVAATFAQVDAGRGVWEAPANVDLRGVLGPAVMLTEADQQDLVAPPDGKAVNPLRHFADRGTLVWGACTLAGLSPEWRYIHVRRTVILLEAALRKILAALAHAPNTADTWDAARSMLEHFLGGLWKRGALMGTTAAHAFNVQVGLGETMTARDVLLGTLRVTVLVAINGPAEFVPITLEQPVQPA